MMCYRCGKNPCMTEGDRAMAWCRECSIEGGERLIRYGPTAHLSHCLRVWSTYSVMPSDLLNRMRDRLHIINGHPPPKNQKRRPDRGLKPSERRPKKGYGI